MKSILASKYLVWAVMALPALGMLSVVLSGSPAAIENALHPSGEFSARFMIAALMITPLRMLFPKTGFLRWLLKHRRAFGVAAFLYALWHTVLYLLHTGALARIMEDVTQLGIWTGWAALLLFVPLGLTSNDAAVKALGTGWKKLQRLAYPAAVLTLLHWCFVNNDMVAAAINFAPLGLLQAYRLWRHYGGSTGNQAMER